MAERCQRVILPEWTASVSLAPLNPGDPRMKTLLEGALWNPLAAVSCCHCLLIIPVLTVQ